MTQRLAWAALVLVLLIGAGLGACGSTPVSPVVVHTPAETLPDTTSSAGVTAEVTLTTAAKAGETLAATDTPVVWFEAQAPGDPTAEPSPWPTFTATPVPTGTQSPTPGPSPRFTRTPTRTGTATATRTPPDATLRIARPGRYSKIVSPYKMEAMITRGEDGYVYLSLTGESGQVFQAQALDYRSSEYNRFLVVPQIEFSISTVAETARLALETRDRLGRPMAISSVDVVLLSIGENEVNPAQRLSEPFVIESPRDGAEVQGGRFTVSARVLSVNSSPLIVSLTGEAGEELARQELQMGVPGGASEYVSVVIDLDYRVTQATQARLSIRQESDNRIPGTLALSSVSLTLYP